MASFRKRGDKWYFRIKAVYTPQFYSAQEIRDLPIKIIGRVIEVRRTL